MKPTVEQEEAVVNMYLEHKSGNVVAEKFGTTTRSIYDILRKHNIERNGLQHWRENAVPLLGEETKVLELYQSGKTLNEINSELGGRFSKRSIGDAIRRAGGEIRIRKIGFKEGEREKVEAMIKEGLSQFEIARRLNRSQSAMSRLVRKEKIVTPNVRSGENHSRWKGGRITTSEGYIRAMVKEDDSLACMRDTKGYVPEHRLVMARTLGRPLRDDETVHHVNGNRQDNRPENLQLRHGQHGKGVGLYCIDCGSRNIGYDPLVSDGWNQLEHDRTISLDSSQWKVVEQT